MRVMAICLAVALVLALAPQAYAAPTSLWASDSSNGSSSTLFELDRTTGAVLSSLPGPGVFADALSFSNDGQSIFVLDSSTDSDVYQIDLAGVVLNSFSIALDAEGLTILQDGSLVIGGGNSNTVAFVNPNNGAILSQFSPNFNIFGLASNGTDRLFGLRINGIIDTYDLSGTLLGSLNTGISGTTLGLTATDTGGFFVSVVSSDLVFEIAGDGTALNSFRAPGPFTEGLDLPSIQVQAPEPGTLVLVGVGIVGLIVRRRRRGNATN